MTRRIQVGLVDLLHAAISRGANFIIVAVTFFVASRMQSTAGFVSFVYQWGLAIMVGNVLLGSLSTAAIRSKTLHGGFLPTKTGLFVEAYGAGLIGGTAVLLSALWLADFRGVAATVVLGISMQSFNASVTIARALKHYRLAVSIAGTAVGLIIATQCLLLYLGNEETAVHFAWASFSFLVAVVVGQVGLRLVQERAERAGEVEPRVMGDKEDRDFWNTVAIFAAGNLFINMLINIDFTIMTHLGVTGELAPATGTKIYFERFIMPAMNVLMSVASLEVLREKVEADAFRSSPLHFRVDGTRIGLGVLVFTAAVIGYYVYRWIYAVTSPVAPLYILLPAAVGYLFYGIMLFAVDVYLLATKPAVIWRNVFAFAAVYVPVQYFVLSSFGVMGWALSWVCTMAFLLWFLVRDLFRIDWGR